MSWGCDVSVLQLQFYHSHLIPKLIFLFIQITDVHIVKKKNLPLPQQNNFFLNLELPF